MTRLYDILTNLAERTRNDVEYVEDIRDGDDPELAGESDIVALTSGTRIAFHTQYNIFSDATMTITLKGGSTVSDIPVYKHGDTRLSNFTFAGAILPMTYISPYKVRGETVASAAWLLDGGAGALDAYTDDYVVTPTFNLQTLDTGGKFMNDDVRVREISVHKDSTTGTSGFTVSIPG